MTTKTGERSYESVWEETAAILAGRQSGTGPPLDGATLKAAVTEKLGVATIAELRAVTVKELGECGVPAPLARVLIGNWRDAGNVAGGRKLSLAELRAIPYQSPRALLDLFDPAEPTSAVGVRIARLAKNRPTLVFLPDGSLDREASAEILQELLEGETPRTLRRGATSAARIYKVGEGPGNYRLIHPLDGSQLRKDGTGSEDGLAWGGLGDDVRSVVILAVRDTREIDPRRYGADRVQLVSLFTALVHGGMTTAATLAPEAFVLYEERRHAGGLPPLRTLRTIGRTDTRTVGRGDPARALRQ